MTLDAACYQVTRHFPHDEIFGMTSQIRRSAASIPTNIAEGNGRGSRKEYIHYLWTAHGSLKELETHLFLAHAVHLTDQVAITPLLDQADQLGKMLRTLIRKLQPPRPDAR